MKAFIIILIDNKFIKLFIIYILITKYNTIIENMFNRYTKKQKTIIYILILCSCIFIITIFGWIMFFIGYAYCHKEMLETMKIATIEQEKPESIKDNSVLDMEL